MEAPAVPPPDESPLRLIRTGGHALDALAALIASGPRFEPTEAGLADVCAWLFADGLAFVPELGRWIYYDGMRWAPDVAGLVMQSIRLVLIAAQRNSALDPRMRKGLISLERASSLRGIQAIAATAPGLVKLHSSFDADPDKLNTPGGLLDLRTLEIVPHDPRHNCMRLAGYTPDFEGPAPIFGRFCLDVSGGDEELAAWKVLRNGYELTGSIAMQDFCIRTGGGANGKSVEGELELRLWGDYAAEVSPEILMESATSTGGSAAPQLLEFHGLRKILASETEDGRKLNIGLVKLLTGGDVIRARALYSNHIAAFRMQGKISLRTNHVPFLRRVDHAIQRRLKIVPYPAKFEGPARDPVILDKLLSEAPAIMATYARAAKHYLETLALPPCAAIEGASSVYMEEQDPIGRWIGERCEVNAFYSTKSGDLFASFCDFLKGENMQLWTQASFGRALTERGFEEARTAKVRLRKGLRICDE
jgi:putative DNA primase/helicase